MAEFKPTDQQAEALDMIEKRLDAGEPVTKLFGYAGTGKTTLAKHIAANYGGQVAFAAFTGKAASVLTRKGCPAHTIHSWIYLPIGDRRKLLERLEEEYEQIEDPMSDYGISIHDQMEELRANINAPGFALNPASELIEKDLLVVDEVSMVNRRMGEDLLSFGVPTIVLGDPAQLPPVAGGGFFTKGGERRADAMLTDVQRQALESPIYKMATWVRKNQTRLPYGKHVVKAVRASEAKTYDQILCGTNKTRRTKNARMRRLLGFSNILEPGEKIICLENNKEFRVLNGQQFYILEIRESSKDDIIEALLMCDCNGGQMSAIPFRCGTCGWYPEWRPLWNHGFLGEAGEGRLAAMDYNRKRAAMAATYGYVITVHKSQGSEWNRVLVFDESQVFRKDAWRWLYTAVTRAAEEVTVVR